MKTNFNNFINENMDLNLIEPKLKILKKYIKNLKELEKTKFYNPDEFNIELSIIQYFIILHNFLILEQKYYNEVKTANKEINKYLELEDTNDINKIKNKFKELYDSNNNIRFAIETFDSIEPIRIFLKNNRYIYNKLLRKYNNKFNI